MPAGMGGVCVCVCGGALCEALQAYLGQRSQVSALLSQAH